MASKFVVYIAVVYVSCIAFCTVDSVRLKKVKRCGVSRNHHKPFFLLRGRLNGKCVTFQCRHTYLRVILQGCELKRKCYLLEETVNGKKCSKGGRWT
ncbi:hypothetical protein PoB_002451900 [Plakobranchus ocellatus]|uniref:Secreted protein n=1 Tax=Plakobranchus ocellatus TaxID=259542 RepID=A0AAV3ZUC2_9GAST|nr:hypothetical protein PoB_002451900 [Plakobranchus ocellatus]